MDAPKKIKSVGSRAEVFHGTAQKTSSGLLKSDLFISGGRIKSKKASAAAKKHAKRKLGKYLQKKGSGQFGPKKD